MRRTLSVLGIPIIVLLCGCSFVHPDYSIQSETSNETAIESSVQVSESLEDAVTETEISRSQEIIDWMLIR